MAQGSSAEAERDVNECCVFFPDEAREAVKDGLAERGITPEEAWEAAGPRGLVTLLVHAFWPCVVYPER